MAKVTARDIAVALGRGKEKANGPGKGWQCFCPAHDNTSTPKLTVTDGRDGKLLVYCQAGCPNDAVVSELKRMDLWPKSSKTWVAQKWAPPGTPDYSGFEHPREGKPKRWWKYVDDAGRTRGYVVRFEKPSEKTPGKVDKTTIPLTWCRCEEDGSERLWWKGFPEPRVPYGHDLLAAGRGKHVLVVEGEKSCDAARAICGDAYVVVCWQGGSHAVKRTDWSCLKSRDVTLWPDADRPGDQAMRDLAEILLAENAKVVRRVDVSADILVQHGLDREDAEGWDLADEIPLTLDVAGMLHSAQQYFPVGDEVVERFNRDHAMVMIGGAAVVLEERLEEGVVRTNYLSVAGFREFYGNRNVVSGKQQVPESAHWLKHPGRRSYRSVTFKPVADTPNQYNLWRGFSVEPDPTGSWDMLKSHVLENVARGDESLATWVTGWFAHLVQHPDIKLGTSVALRGAMGTGKTVLGSHMGALYKPHYVLVDKPSYVVGNFNAHLASCLLLHADEAFFAGSPANAGVLRGMVTADTVRIEPKGKDSFELRSYMRLFVSSNNSWVVPAGAEERRFAVLDIGEGKMQNKAFFQEMGRQMRDGGYAAMLHDLLKFDLGTVDVGVIPQTRALQDQKLHSLDSVTRFWFQKLEAGETLEGSGVWPTHVVMADVYRDYVETCQRWGEARRHDLHFFCKESKNFWPCDKDAVKQVRVTTKDSRSRPWAWVAYPLDRHRERMELVLGHPVDWRKEHAEEAQQGRPEDDLPF